MDIIGLTNLCTPAFIYFLLSIASVIMIGLQNVLAGGPNNYCVGIYTCSTTNVVALFLMKILFILFWTWVLNIICKNVSEYISWVLVLLPLTMMFLFMGLVFVRHTDFNKYVPSVGLN